MAHPPSPRSGALLTDPVRYPQAAPEGLRTRRAVILLLLTLVLPGAAQVVAGDRRLGRRALLATFTAWMLVLAAVLLAFVNRAALVDLLTHGWLSYLIIALLALFAVGWALLFLDTLRIIRPPLLRRRMRPVIAVSLAALMTVTSGSLGYGAYLLNVSRQTVGSVFQAGPAFDPVDGRYNFLLMGGDAGADRTGLRPDSMSVISVDADTGKTSTFSLPRNFQNAPFGVDSPLWQIWPGGYNCGDECILNSLYQVVTDNYPHLYPEGTDPGAEAMMDAASGILGLEVQGYVTVDMAGFERLIDAMGGITVNSGGWVPITAGEIPGTNRHYPPDGWIPPGVQKLDGYHALWYARSREFVTDYHRIARQQCVQQAMISQLDPATLLTRFQSIASAGEQMVRTNIPADQLGSFLDLALDARSQPVDSMTIGPPDFGTAADNFVTYPDFDLIHARVQERLAGSAEPAPADPAAPGEEPAEPETDQGAPGPGEAAPAAPADPQPEPAAPEITEAELQELARMQDDATLGMLLDSNSQCSPG